MTKPPKGTYTPRFSFAELERFVARHHGPDPALGAVAKRYREGRLVTDGFIANLVGVHRTTVWQWRAQGDLGAYVTTTEDVADALGVWPGDIWPGYADALDEYFAGCAERNRIRERRRYHANKRGVAA